MTSYKTKDEIIKHYKISKATFDNWIKNAIPEAYNLEINAYDMNVFEQYIKTHKKLESRANKKSNKKVELPKSLFEYLDKTEWVNAYFSYIENKDYDTVSLNILNLYKNRLLNETNNVDETLVNIIPEDDFYAYSVCYQLLLDSGSKSELGAYYTPKHIVVKEVNKYLQKDATFLEPCSGCGFYVVEYIKAYKKEFNQYPDGLIYANDIDKNAAELTRLNIIAITENSMPDFTVTNENGLDLPYKNSFDLVITNPPYGIKNVYNNLKSTEIFTHFIDKSLCDYLKPDGLLSFVLPVSFLNVKKHHEIRQKVIDNFNILEIDYYGKSFSDVLSDIIVIGIKNKHELNNFLKNDGKVFEQSYFKNHGYIISKYETNDYDFLKNVYDFPHVTLKNETFALGIVTGNNKEYLSDTESDLFPYPILSGKNIESGFISGPMKYIYKDFDKFQQKPPMAIFVGGKIIYKFISKRIVTVVDYTDSYTLNSANVIKLKAIDFPLEYVSALLNSDIVNKIFTIKFSNPLKVLKNDLMDLPLFIFDSSIVKEIVENYNKGFHDDNNKIIEKALELKEIQ